MLGSDHEQLARSFARSGDERGLGRRRTTCPARPAVHCSDGVHAAIDCRVYAIYPGGDHAIVVGEVQHIHVDDRPGDALLWFRSTFGSVRDPRGVLERA